MNIHSTALALGWGAVVVGLVAVLAQYRRAARRGVEGISLATWILFVYMGGFWITYGTVSAHSWEVVLGSLVVLPFQVSIVIDLAPWRHGKIVLQALAFFVVSCVVPTVIWGWPGGVYGTGVAMTVNRAPQLVELIRQRDATGVSANSWFLSVAGAMMWVAYYTGVHLWAPLIATLFAGVCNLAIALLATWRHAQSRASSVASDIAVA